MQHICTHVCPMAVMFQEPRLVMNVQKLSSQPEAHICPHRMRMCVCRDSMSSRLSSADVLHLRDSVWRASCLHVRNIIKTVYLISWNVTCKLCGFCCCFKKSNEICLFHWYVCYALYIYIYCTGSLYHSIYNEVYIMHYILYIHDQTKGLINRRSQIRLELLLCLCVWLCVALASRFNTVLV